jgi:hypothetical protein
VRWLVARLACVFGFHRSAYAVMLGVYPLFPIRCETCGSHYYVDRPDE